ncbi:MAG: phosphatase PAP2 family protein [Hyphomicrobium sp.]
MTVSASNFYVADSHFRQRFLIATVTVAAAVCAVFMSFPELDLVVARAISAACPQSAGKGHWCPDNSVEPVRQAYIWFFISVCAISAVGLMRGRIASRPLFGMCRVGRMGWLFLAINFIVGVGLVVNLGFKDHWGRARPRHLVEFGGSKSFSPPLTPAEQCRKNCSFVSGEAASIYAPFFATAVILPAYGWPLAAAGVVAGISAGIIRMLSGAHFLSDVLFAGIITAFVAIALHAMIFGLRRSLLDAGATQDPGGTPDELEDWWREVRRPARAGPYNVLGASAEPSP